MFNRLYEELPIDGRNAEGTAHPRIMKAIEATTHPEGMNQLLSVLKEALNSNDEARVRKVLFEALGPEFTDSDRHLRLISGK